MPVIKEVEFERTYNAPLEKVWQAWTDPRKLKMWWGPENVSIPECEIDLRVGGKFYIVMEAGEGMGPYKGIRWPMQAEFTAVVPNSLLSYTSKAWTEGNEDSTQIDQVNELSFSGDGDKTKLKLKVTVTSIGPDAGMALQGMQQGFDQHFDKLVTFLKKQ